jgi:hypothetical protein
VDVALVGLVAGSGWASGVNLYLVVLALGLAGRGGLIEVPTALTRTDVLLVAGILVALEFLVDKVPYLDSLWDVIHTVVRPLGAALVGLALTGDADSFDRAVAAFSAGGLATASHVAKATTRAAINTSPEPGSNIAVSLIEDGLVLAVVWFAINRPVLAIALVVTLLAAGTVLTIVLIGAARRGVRAWRERRRRSRPLPQPRV